MPTLRIPGGPWLNRTAGRGTNRIHRREKGKGPDAHSLAETRSGIPEWELLGYTPAVFRKSADPCECKRVVKHSLSKERKERMKGALKRCHVGTSNVKVRRMLVNHNTLPPLFFVSVAAKGLSPTVSLLFATLAGRCIS